MSYNWLEELNLPLTGTKPVLRERLKGAWVEDSDAEQNEAETAEEIDALLKVDLVTRNRDLHLEVTGNKAKLRARLKSA